jgi:hypothetical protein
MATRMQQRRGTSTQWTSSNDGDGPILNAGEIGWESNTNKFKIGDGVNNWIDLPYFVDATDLLAESLGGYVENSDIGAISGVAGLDASKNLVVPGTSVIIEGATADSYETTLTVVDPTAARTITFPNATGTVITTGNLSDITNIGVFTSTITMEGSSADDNELTLSAGNPTADRTLTFPDATDTLVGRATTDTLTNKTINATSNTITIASTNVSDFNEAAQDAVGGILGTGLSYNDGGNGIGINNAALTTYLLDGVSGSSYGLIGTSTYLDIVNTNGYNKEIELDIVSVEAKLVTDGFAKLAAPALTGDATAVNLTISGNLTVNGTTTNLNSTNLVVEDKNIILADVETPTDTTANGGGITLKGATDKTLNWVDATDAWTSSEDFNLLTGKVYEIAGTSVLSGTTLGSGVTASSLTSVGTITSGTWTGTTIAIANGGTGQTTAMAAATALLPDQASNSGKYLTNDGSGTLSWGTVTGYSAPTLGSTSIASGATVTTIVGLTKVRSDVFTTLDASGYEVDLETMQIMGAL